MTDNNQDNGIYEVKAPSTGGSNTGDDNSGNTTPPAQTENLIPLNQETKPEPSVSFNLDEQNQPPSAENDELVDTIVSNTTTPEPEIKPPVLPELGDDQLSQAEYTSLELELKNNARLATISRNILVGVVLMGTLMGGFFYFRFQNTQQTAFNATLTLNEVMESSGNLESEYNFKLYQLIDRSMQDLVWDAMEFIQHYQIGSNQVASLRQSINQRLTTIGALTGRLTIFSASDPKAARANLLSSIPKELENTSVNGIMRNKDLHETLYKEKNVEAIVAKPNPEFVTWLEDFLSKLEIPETILLKINKDRLLWSQIIAKIEAKTREIDPLFGDPENQFIQYSNYNFNSRTNQITLTGQIKTEDSKTFTRIANLIDAIENDPYFQNVKTRSFTKNPVPASEEELDGYYQATLKLDFEFIRNGNGDSEDDEDEDTDSSTNS